MFCSARETNDSSRSNKKKKAKKVKKNDDLIQAQPLRRPRKMDSEPLDTTDGEESKKNSVIMPGSARQSTNLRKNYINNLGVLGDNQDPNSPKSGRNRLNTNDNFIEHADSSNNLFGTMNQPSDHRLSGNLNGGNSSSQILQTSQMSNVSADF